MRDFVLRFSNRPAGSSRARQRVGSNSMQHPKEDSDSAGIQSYTYNALKNTRDIRLLTLHPGAQDQCLFEGLGMSGISQRPVQHAGRRIEADVSDDIKRCRHMQRIVSSQRQQRNSQCATRTSFPCHHPRRKYDLQTHSNRQRMYTPSNRRKSSRLTSYPL